MSRTTENTPLLLDPTVDELGSPSYERYLRIVERHQQRCTKAIFILTWSSALLAVFILVLNLTLMFIYLARFGDIRPWSLESALVGLFCTVCFDVTHMYTPQQELATDHSLNST
jgi:ABC-type transport system involved in Fe-S cluster assembly fused permease/ATPase subunit